MSTGWWGLPGDGTGNCSTKVHVEVDGKPACGFKVRPEMIYQWCCPGVNANYVECTHCTRMIKEGKLNVY